MYEEILNKLQLQIDHAIGCQDVDGSKKGFIKGLEFAKMIVTDLQNLNQF